MKQLFGGLLLGSGILIMATSGLCSLVVIIGGFSEAMRNPSIILFPLVVGGIPFVVGFCLFRLGQWILRRSEDDSI